MLAARERGDRVVLVTATRGEHGTDDPVRWPADRLGARGRASSTPPWPSSASPSTGGSATRTGRAAWSRGAPRADRVAAIVDEVRPDTIVTFADDGFTGHADHRTVAAWTHRAWRAAAPDADLVQAVLPRGFTRRFAAINEEFGVFMDAPADEVEPDRHLRLSGERLDRKIAAMLAQDSQTRRLVEGVGLATFRRWWAEESFVVRTSAGVRAA